MNMKDGDFMRIEKISYNKIKLIVSIEDLHALGVTPEEITDNSPQTQELFWNLLRRAEMETDFSLSASHLIIEATPIKNEGLILIVTKLDDETEEYFDKIRLRQRRTRYKVKIPQEIYEQKTIFAFDNFEDLLKVANILDANTNSKLYEYNEKFFLLIPETVIGDFYQIHEFGVLVPNSQFNEAFLSEHGNLIIPEKAILKLREHFNS